MPKPAERRSPLLTISALVFAASLVAAGLAVTRPWIDDTGFGIVTWTGAASSEIGTRPGMLAPDFLLEKPEGGTLRLSDLRGSPVVVNFWATWCIYCAAEMPAIQEVADRYAGLLQVVGVNAGEASTDIVAFSEITGVRFPLLLDRDTEVTEAYGVAQMPTTIFIDRDGFVRSVVSGPVTTPMMLERIAPLLTNP